MDAAVADRWALRNCSARSALLRGRAGPVLGPGRWVRPWEPSAGHVTGQVTHGTGDTVPRLCTPRT